MPVEISLINFIEKCAIKKLTCVVTLWINVYKCLVLVLNNVVPKFVYNVNCADSWMFKVNMI